MTDLEDLEQCQRCGTWIAADGCTRCDPPARRYRTAAEAARAVRRRTPGELEQLRDRYGWPHGFGRNSGRY